MFSYFEPNFIEKFLWESGFQILAKIEMTRNKNRLCGRHFKTVLKQHSFFFSESWFFTVHTLMMQISFQNSGGKVVFLEGFRGTSLVHQRELKYLGHFNVKEGCMIDQ